MSSKGKSATARLKQDYLRIVKDPVPYVTAHPLPSNILEWHYVILGPEDTPYEGGIYHGKLTFPPEFPYKPPSIYIITPNGRFKCNTRLCLSISDFHPDTWNPAWSVSTILTGLLSFMVEKKPTLGSIETSIFEKKQLALRSGEFNLKNKVFCELFPDLAEEIGLEIERRKSALCEMPESADSESQLSGSLHDGGAGGPVANVIVIVCFAIFAYAVKYVLMSMV